MRQCSRKRLCPPGLEKLPEQISRPSAIIHALNEWPMMTGRLLEELYTIFYRPSFRVGRRVNQTRNTGQ